MRLERRCESLLGKGADFFLDMALMGDPICPSDPICPEGKRIPWLVLVVRRIAFWVVAATGRCSRKNRVFSIGREKGGPPEEKTNWHLAGSHEKGAAVRIG